MTGAVGTADFVLSRLVCASASQQNQLPACLTPENLKQFSGSSPCSTGPPSLLDESSELGSSDDGFAGRDMSGLVSGMDLRKVLCPRLSSEIWH